MFSGVNKALLALEEKAPGTIFDHAFIETYCDRFDEACQGWRDLEWSAIEEASGLTRKELEAFAGDSGLLPEQIWDAPDIPELGLKLGKFTGAAMPLVWAHAEYVKLLRSVTDGKIFDRISSVAERYGRAKRPAWILIAFLPTRHR